MKQILKKIGAEALVLLVFASLSIAYFYTPISQEMRLTGGDNTAADAANQEMSSYSAQTGERSRWTNSLFCGMPTYQMAPSYDSSDHLNFIEKLCKLFLPSYAGYLFVLMLGFYIMLRAFDFRLLYATLGSILWAFSSYFVVIIAVGHIWKLMALAYIPPTIGGIWLCYKKKYLWGTVVTSLFLALQIKSNHPQMTYYFLPVIAAVSISFLVQAIKTKTFRPWILGSLACLASAVIGLGINASHLYHTYQYTQESVRGKSDLQFEITPLEPHYTMVPDSVSLADLENTAEDTYAKSEPVQNDAISNNGEASTDGLSRNYITQWSYGISETLSLMIPNVKGGISTKLWNNEKVRLLGDKQFKTIYNNVNQYWGEQPFIEGSVYVGAIVMFLFILGLLIVKGPFKRCLLIITLFTVMLSWGSNFMWLTNFFLDYVPMYSKFRTVSSILVVAEFTIPLLAIMALRYILETPNVTKTPVVFFNRYKMSFVACFWISLVLTGYVCFILWVAPNLFFRHFISSADYNALEALGLTGNQLDVVLGDLTKIRRTIFTDDAMRSFLFITFAAVIVWFAAKKKINAKLTILIISALCLLDLWSVDKRYLNDDSFKTTTSSYANTKAAGSQLSPTEKYILDNRSEYSRVLDLSVNTFLDNSTSRLFFSMGGYHAAKLRRYQEIITKYYNSEILDSKVLVQPLDNVAAKFERNDTLIPVLNMLNMEYMIVNLGGGETGAIWNEGANGNAWFVDNVRYVDSADDELNELENLDTKRFALADRQYADILGSSVEQPDSTSVIVLDKYAANKLQYTSSSKVGGVAVFSDIYYPGWTATIDGEEVAIGRVNYLLRALKVPAGEHSIVFSFDPKTLSNTETIANVNLWILLCLILFSAVISFRSNYKIKKSKPEIE